MLLPFESVVGTAREARTLAKFKSRHPHWALLIEAPLPLITPLADKADLVEDREPTREFKIPTKKWDAKTGEMPSKKKGAWPDLWVAWLTPRLEGENILTLGRAVATDVLIRHPTVSTLHLILTEQDDHWQIADQGSSNGTTINGEPVETGGFVSVREGDVLGIGELVKATLLTPDALFKKAR